MLGSIAPPRMHAIMNAVAVPFFDAALRGGTALDAAALGARFSEMTLITHAAGAVTVPDSASGRAGSNASTGRVAGLATDR